MIFITTFCTKTWEQRYLGDLYKKNIEKNKNQFKEDKTISISSMKFNRSGNGAKESSLSNYKVLRIGDIAFEGHKNKEFSFGRFVLNDVGDGIMSPRFTTLRPIYHQNINYWKYYIHNERIMQKVLVRSTKLGTMMNELVVNDFYKQAILVPSSEEQRSIGELLSTIDVIITLQQSQIDYFLKLRKGLIQRIFPSNKASNPKIRYTDFNNNWEQRKLKEVTKEISNKSSEGELLSVTINDGIVKNSSLERKNNSSKNKSKYKKVEIGDIAYNSMRMWQGASGVSKYSGIVSPAYTVFKVKKNVLNNIFLGYSIKTPEMTWKFRINSQGLTSDTWNLKYPLFSEINIQIPSLKEQNYLVNLLESIDKVICSQTKHLKTLKLLKKYFLQKLFM